MPLLDIRTITDPYRFQFALPSRFDVAREQTARATAAVARWGAEREKTKQMRTALEAGDLDTARRIHTGKAPTSTGRTGEKISLAQAEQMAERLASMAGHVRPPAKFLEQQQDYDRRLGRLGALIHRVQMRPAPEKIKEILGEAGTKTPTDAKTKRSFTDAQALNAAAARAKRLKFHPPPSEFTEETKRYNDRLADIATYAMRTGKMPSDQMVKRIMESDPGTVVLPEQETVPVWGGPLTGEEAARLRAGEGDGAEKTMEDLGLPDLVGEAEREEEYQRRLDAMFKEAGIDPLRGRVSIGRGASNMPWTAIRNDAGEVVDVVGGNEPVSLEEYRHGAAATEEERAEAFKQAYEAERNRIEGANLMDESMPEIDRRTIEWWAQGEPMIASGGQMGRGLGARQHPGWIREPQRNPFDLLTNREGRLVTLTRPMADRVAAFNQIINSEPMRRKYGLPEHNHQGRMQVWNGEKEVDLSEMLLGNDDEERRKGLMILARMDRREVRAYANALKLMGYPPIRPTEEDLAILSEIAAKPKGQGWRYEPEPKASMEQITAPAGGE